MERDDHQGTTSAMKGKSEELPFKEEASRSGEVFIHLLMKKLAAKH
ncbi:unnamed protein product [Acanthoscelides obtectus]|uniref:Uncharacterized protein n=1 Tax=Acanthoscelides obtectus TaxID=200917 RepID=A0A9P0M3P8_ACAOB|nr:unnamed protein product [Acanthoscelides obtectus]CAK1646063.1 hypothetical protein AOBTE_LOCUS14428 [Acanthoscelides obtectus]